MVSVRMSFLSPETNQPVTFVKVTG